MKTYIAGLIVLLACVVQAEEPQYLNTAQTMGIEKTFEGRKVLAYLIGCALEKGKRVETTVEGQTYVFDGELGLAPEWGERALSKNSQRWLSACILSRTNVFGIPVLISIRGAHPSLRARLESGDTTLFPVEEAAYYGNIFASSGAVAYVCKGRGPYTPDNTLLKKRVCSEKETPGAPLTRCNFVLTGQCEDVCEFRNSEIGFYSSCRTPNNEVYEEVITTFLKTQGEGPVE